MAVREGDWHCPSCNNHNFAFRDECKRCGAAKAVGDSFRGNGQGGEYRGGGGQGSGTFASLDSIPATSYYEKTDASLDPYSQVAHSSFSGGEFVGGKGRGTGGSYYGGKGEISGNRDVKPGDWICPNCGNNNFAKRSQCNRCGTGKDQGQTIGGENPHLGGHVDGALRPELIPGAVAEGHRPPNLDVKPGDWICVGCRNNNFAWRPECNRCRMPKSEFASEVGKGGKGTYGNGDFGGKGRDQFDGGYGKGDFVGNSQYHFDGKGSYGKGDFGGKGRDQFDGGYGNAHFGGKGRDQFDGGYGKGDFGGKGRDQFDGGYGKGNVGYGGNSQYQFDGKGGYGKGDYGGKGRDQFDGGYGRGDANYGSHLYSRGMDGYGKGGHFVEGKGKGGGKGNSDRFPGDWDCQHCGNNNFARRTECNRCGAPNLPSPIDARHETTQSLNPVVSPTETTLQDSSSLKEGSHISSFVEKENGLPGKREADNVEEEHQSAKRTKP